MRWLEHVKSCGQLGEFACALRFELILRWHIQWWVGKEPIKHCEDRKGVEKGKN